MGFDATKLRTPREKAELIQSGESFAVPQADQLKKPDARIGLSEVSMLPLLSKHAGSYVGLQNGDTPHFVGVFWELPLINEKWELFQLPCDSPKAFGGREGILKWEKGMGELSNSELAYIKGREAWGKQGVAIRQTRTLPATRYTGDLYDQSSAAIIPFDERHLPAVWAYCESSQFHDDVRKIDKKKNVTNATLVKVPFDLAHWQKVAAEKYPHGLPKPFSSDPTQWLFNGHPKVSDQPLHVALARLLGYQWPRQTGSSFPDCPALGPDGLEKLADQDGIVCLSATKGEAPAAERLRAVLVEVLGKFDPSALIASAGSKSGKSETLEEWLRDEFFEQHCALFQHRPFIWHIWDGHKSGFSALVNYHQLTHANLEKLTYAYLGDWIRRQQTAVDAGEAGSDARLQAAKQLQARLKLILEGEPPYDLFVRWKPLSKQAIGWYPDVNDGVRMNIRPFATADILRKRVKITWEKDRGKEPARDKSEYPWFWNGSGFSGDRVNDVHLTKQQKEKATK
jgi:hypothetical protein